MRWRMTIAPIVTIQVNWYTRYFVPIFVSKKGYLDYLKHNRAYLYFVFHPLQLIDSNQEEPGPDTKKMKKSDEL